MTNSHDRPGVRMLARGMSRRRILRGLLFSPALAAVPMLAGCGGDDDAADDSSDDTAAASDDSEDAAETPELPDGFPTDLPLPDQWSYQTNQSDETDEGREIVMIVYGEGDLTAFVQEMNDAIHENFDVEDEFVEDDGEEARWNFSDDEWVYARVNVREYEQNRDLISVSYDMRDH